MYILLAAAVEKAGQGQMGWAHGVPAAALMTIITAGFAHGWSAIAKVLKKFSGMSMFHCNSTWIT